MDEVKQLLKKMEEDMSRQKRLITLKEMAKHLGVSKSYLYKLTSKGLIPHYKPTGKVIYFEKSEVEEWLMKNPIKAVSQLEEEATSYQLRRGRV